MSNPTQDALDSAADLADDSLESIVRQKQDLCDVYSHLRRWWSSDLLPAEIKMAEAITEETFDDLFHNEWNRLAKISGSIRWDRHIPSFTELRRAAKPRPLASVLPELPKPTDMLATVDRQMNEMFRPRRGGLTNPSTLKVVGKL